jgi:calcineurin-like phosphoesterase family protein
MKFLFYQSLKISAKNENVCFWSDTHFNHRCDHWEVPLWKARGFNSVHEHNEGLISRWNAVSNSNTIFFHLGDFIFGYDSIHHFKEIIRRVNFKDLYIMPGNHNSGWKQVFEEQHGNIWKINDHKRVIFVPNYLEACVNGQNLVMSHYPILSFNGQSKDSICLYGHVHGNLIKTEVGKMYSQAKTMELCVETCPSPVTFEEIWIKFKNKTNVSFDHHTNK